MIKIMQSKFKKGEGNCLQACVASVLEMQLDDVEDFGAANEKWFDKLYEWCLERKIGLLYLKKPDGLLLNCNPILTFKVKDNDEEHAVVGRIEMTRGSEWRWQAHIEHDPNLTHPYELGDLTSIIILIPKISKPENSKIENPKMLWRNDFDPTPFDPTGLRHSTEKKDGIALFLANKSFQYLASSILLPVSCFEYLASSISLRVARMSLRGPDENF